MNEASLPPPQGEYQACLSRHLCMLSQSAVLWCTHWSPYSCEMCVFVCECVFVRALSKSSGAVH